MVNPFWNPAERRLRAGWRIVLHLVLLTALGTLLSFARGGDLLPSPLDSTLAFFLIVTSGTWLASRFLDRRRFSDLGLALDTDWWADLAFGLGLGVFLMGAVFLAEYVLGWITIAGTFRTSYPGEDFGTQLLLTALALIYVGWYEELLSRGYHLKNLAEGLNFARTGPRMAILLALALSSAFFGLAHAVNPNASAVSTFNIMLAGLLLGVPYVLTGRLGASIGLHVTWNFAQGAVFGFPVSGTEDFTTAQVIATDQLGPELWTGGDFGPEAGLTGLLAILAGVALTVLYTRVRYGTAALYLDLAHPPHQQAEIWDATGASRDP